MSLYEKGLNRRIAFQKQSRIAFQKQSRDYVGLANPRRFADEVRMLDDDVESTEKEISAQWHEDHEEWLASLTPEQRVVLSDVEKDFPRHPNDPARPLYRFWADVWSPFRNEWDRFRTHYTEGVKGRIRALGSDRDVIHHRRNQLRSLREGARKLGATFQSPEPIDPPESMWEKLGSTLQTVLIIAGVTIAGVVGLAIVRRTEGSSTPALPSGSKSEQQAAAVARRIQEKSK